MQHQDCTDIKVHVSARVRAWVRYTQGRAEGGWVQKTKNVQIQGNVLCSLYLNCQTYSCQETCKMKLKSVSQGN